MPSAPERSHSLGIDIGGTSVKAAAITASGSTVTASSPAYARPDAARITEAVRAALTGLCSKRGAGDLRDLFFPGATVGLCAPGLIDPATTQITLAANLPSLVGTRLDQLIAHAAGLNASPTLTIVSDALAAATDFRLTAQPPITGRLLAISLGTGVGACVLDDSGQLLVNPGTSGHLGQIDVSLNDDAPIAPDGSRGGLEAYIGLPALRARFGDDLTGALRSLSTHDPAVRALVRAVRIAHAIYRPHHIALLGGVGLALAASPVAPALRGLIAHDLTTLARPDWSLMFAVTPYHAALGAARLSSKMNTTAR